MNLRNIVFNQFRRVDNRDPLGDGRILVLDGD